MGILGAARIGPAAVIRPARAVPGLEVVGVAARDADRGQRFAARHRLERVYRDYEELLDDPSIDAVYNPLPNSLHAPWTIRALRAGKHVLCEKPLASNALQAEAMERAANETGRVLSEGFAYRYHPLAARMLGIVQSGELGTVRHVEAELRVLLLGSKDIRFRFDLGGGATMDVGCYPISLIRFLAASEPAIASASPKMLSPQVDSQMTAQLSFTDGRTGTMVCDFKSHAVFRSVARVRGDRADLTVVNPFHPHLMNWLVVRSRSGTRWEHVRGENAYVLQLQAFVRAIQQGAASTTATADGVANMRVIDAVYLAAGLEPRPGE